jgi:hypothetical protein
MTDMALIYDEDDINDILEDTVCVNGKCSKIRHNFSWIYWVIGIIIIIFFVFWIIERKTNPRNRFPRY